MCCNIASKRLLHCIKKLIYILFLDILPILSCFAEKKNGASKVTDCFFSVGRNDSF